MHAGHSCAKRPHRDNAIIANCMVFGTWCTRHSSSGCCDRQESVLACYAQQGSRIPPLLLDEHSRQEGADDSELKVYEVGQIIVYHRKAWSPQTFQFSTSYALACSCPYCFGIHRHSSIICKLATSLLPVVVKRGGQMYVRASC